MICALDHVNGIGEAIDEDTTVANVAGHFSKRRETDAGIVASRLFGTRRVRPAREGLFRRQRDARGQGVAAVTRFVENVSDSVWDGGEAIDQQRFA